METMENLDVIHVLQGRRYLFAAELSLDMNDYRKYEDMRQEIWKEPSDHMGGVRNLACANYFDRGSTLFTGTFVEDKTEGFPRDRDHMVGFSYGFVGVRDKKIGFRSVSNLSFYSQYLGVRKGFQGLGLGMLTKEYQKKVVLETMGVETMICTYDPLVGVNASRNIHHFGMDVDGYKESYYPDFGGALNRVDLPSDRLLVSWDLTRKNIQRPAYELHDLVKADLLVISSKMWVIEGKKGPVNLEVVAEVRSDWHEDYALVEIPFDFYKMLGETDVPDESIRKIPIDWRLATRKVFQELFKRKYKIVDFRIYQDKDRKRGFYVLKN